MACTYHSALLVRRACYMHESWISFSFSAQSRIILSTHIYCQLATCHLQDTSNLAYNCIKNSLPHSEGSLIQNINRLFRHRYCLTWAFPTLYVFVSVFAVLVYTHFYYSSILSENILNWDQSDHKKISMQGEF